MPTVPRNGAVSCFCSGSESASITGASVAQARATARQAAQLLGLDAF